MDYNLRFIVGETQHKSLIKKGRRFDSQPHIREHNKIKTYFLHNALFTKRSYLLTLKEQQYSMLFFI